MANLKSQFDPMDDEERWLMEAIERGEARPVPKEEEEKIRSEIIASAAKNITIRMKRRDIDGMKAKAARMGLNYQTLINTLVHRYLAGTITFNEQFGFHEPARLAGFFCWVLGVEEKEGIVKFLR